MAEQDNNANQNSESNILTGFVLLQDANLDWPRFRHNLKEDWGINVSNDDVKDNAVVFDMDGTMVACSLMPSPVPEQEAERFAANNIFWKDAQAEVAKHNAHCLIAIMTKADPVEQSLLFAKVASSMLKLKNAIGIYKYPTVYNKDFYIDMAKLITSGEFPTPIIIHVGMYLDKGLMFAYTSGMKLFGKEEIEVVLSKAQPNDLLNFMMSISEYCITSDSVLKDGETIGFTEDQKLQITYSDGVSLPFKTIKIAYMTEQQG